MASVTRYVTGWMNYFGISHTYKMVRERDEWLRRRVRLYHWKQWKQPRTRRRNLIKLGADPDTVHMATRSRKGYWRMSANSIVHRALNNQWLKEQGVPEMRDIWIKLHYGDGSTAVPKVCLEPPGAADRRETASQRLPEGRAQRGKPACRVVWVGWQAQSCHPDPIERVRCAQALRGQRVSDGGSGGRGTRGLWDGGVMHEDDPPMKKQPTNR